VIGITGRYVAAYLGSRWIKQQKLHSRLIADAHIPGGEMQIVIGMLALEYCVITETVYVAVVFGAVVTSMISGPLMERLMKRIRKIDWLVHLPVDNIFPQINAKTSKSVILQICHAASRVHENLAADLIAEAVMSREAQMSTAINHSVAVPHARLAGLKHPLLLFGKCPNGVDWNAQDGIPVRHIFLVLSPESDADFQLQVLRGIAETLDNESVRRSVDEADNSAGILECLRTASRLHSTKEKYK
jgi:mannitol/fructose-specific phosphotransferase system IIA component (Ntr-type)